MHYVVETPECTSSFEEKKLKHVLSTIVQMLDVITSFNCNCYPRNEGLKK
jgi:hypothetical protein